MFFCIIFKIAPNQSVWTCGSSQGSHGPKPTFKWIATGSKFDYTNWNKGQPDNKAPTGGPECCVAMESYWNYKWNDKDCIRELYYVCQKRIA